MKLFLWVCLLLPLHIFGATDLGYQMYRAANVAPDVESRDIRLNEALKFYKSLERSQPSSTLDFNIANTYFLLGKTSYAILYYYRGLEKEPGNVDLYNNLSIALEKAHLEKETGYPKWTYSQKERLTYSILFVAFAILSLSCWYRLRSLKLAGGCLFIFSLVLSAKLLYPIKQAIVIDATYLRDAPNSSASFVVHKPIPAGLKVDMLSENEKNKMLKVRTPKGVVGYIPKEKAENI